MKLLAFHNVDISRQHATEVAQFAVLDVLLALDFEPNRTRMLQEEMVRSHMRIAYSVPHHREYFRSGYSSEPLLAEAAAQQIHEFQKHSVLRHDNVMVEILTSNWDTTTLIDLGQHGEVVMRLLLTQAYMDGVLAENASPIIFSRGCKLIKFIEHLFSPLVANKILASKPDNVPFDKSFSDVFANSVVRFTHFVKAGDTSAMTTEALFAAFARGMAFIGHPTQNCVDFAIPVLLDAGDALQESAMSAILVQIKRQVTVRSQTAYAFTQEQVGLFQGEDPENKEAQCRPYITLIAELGGEPKKSKPSIPSIYVSQQPEKLHHPRGTHPHFGIVAYGCSDVMYRVIQKGQNLAYETLLATHHFLSEHPRQDDQSCSAVMKLKSVWAYGKNSYHWVDVPFLNEE